MRWMKLGEENTKFSMQLLLKDIEKFIFHIFWHQMDMWLPHMKKLPPLLGTVIKRGWGPHME
jgi:hypothetical protein